jgi:energy-coupling factor transporter ATP-binding protein EcfA2
MIADLLTRLEEEKNQWIYEAIDHFNEGFLRFDGQKYEKDQVLIGVYGPTQVGKTTLILTMLGIGDKEIGPLSQALRGKREKGNSSTITSFIYKRSVDENFHLIFPDKTRISCRDLEELETALQTIRKQIESGKVSYDKPIILDIAQQFFSNKRFAEKSKFISIIDLPGDDTKEKREEEYVEHILTRYMPLCSVCLVMEISSKIVRLFQLDRPLVKDWMYYPQNFRVVLTRCLQSASVKRAIEAGEITSLAEFKANFRDHLQRNELEIPNQIYPLEFGDTWLELKDRNDVVYHQAKGWMDSLFLELLDDLTAVKTPENQIMQIKNIEHSISKQKNLELDRMSKEITTIEESQEEDQRVYENLKSTVHYLQEELEFYEAERKGLDVIQLEKYRSQLYSYFEFDKKDQVVFKERKTSKLLESFQMAELEMLDFYQKRLADTWLLLTRSMQNISSTVRFDFKTDPPLLGLSLSHGRGLDQYLKLGNFEEDYQIVLDTLARNNNIIYDYYVSQINQFKHNGKKEILQLSTLKDEHKKLADENLLAEQEKQKQKQARKIELQDKWERAKREWDEDLLRPKLLDDILKEEFVKAVSGWQEKLYAEDASDVERWAYHQYCQIILKQAERIIGNDYF